VRTMECRIYIESLTALMDNELPQEEVSIIQRHLVVCESCNQEYRSLLYSNRLVEHLRQLDSKAELWNQIESRLRSPEEKRGFFSFVFPSFVFPKLWLPVGALGALVFFTASLLWFGASHNRSEEMHQLLRNYMQEREREFAEKGVQIQGQGAQGVRLVQYNPFSENVPRPNGNPFKAE
jgi:hypothetical protein